MNLEQRYTEAGASTNAGQARLIGTTDAPATNFFDAVGRGQDNAAPDEYQTEFKTNAPGDFRYGGGGKVAGTYTLSRFLEKARNFGDTLYSNNKFTNIIAGDVRNAPNTEVHKFKPESGKTFQESSALSEFAKAKAL